MFKSQLKRLCLPALVLVAALAIFGGFKLATSQSPQVAYYNDALVAENAGNVDKAMAFYDKSLQSYADANKADWLSHLLYGRPSDEIASMAHFRKGVLLLVLAQQQKKPGIMAEAVDELKASLKANPGAPYREGISSADAKRMNEEALVVKHDLDLIFEQHPEQQQGQGQGKGQGQGQGPAQQAPGQQPGNKPGHGGSDGL